jgi:Zn-finger nucleic acid-binding protein
LRPERDQALLCPHCSRPYRLGGEKCIWCGGALPADVTPEILPHCPACTSPLEARNDSGLLMFPCPTCWGIWLSLPALKAFERLYEQIRPLKPAGGGKTAPPLARADGLADFSTRQRYRSCPLCGDQMARRRYQRVADFVVDQCMAHGVWFDPGEFDMAVEFLSRGGLERGRKAEARFRPSLGGFAELQLDIERFYRMYVAYG